MYIDQSQLKDLLPILYRARIPVYIWGSFGVGKSAIVKELANQLNLEFIDLRMSTIEGIDLRGMPEKRDNFIEWLPPKFFVERNPKYAGKAIFLDELNTALPSTQAAAYQLVLDRCLGDSVVLHDNDWVIAAGNMQEDRGATFDIAYPLANRFFNIFLTNSYDSFEKYAMNSGLHSAILGYLAGNRQDLHTYDPEQAQLLNATNRTWEMLSELIKQEERVVNSNGEVSTRSLDDKLLRMLASGLIPETVVTKFIDHYNDSARFPTFKSILAGKPDKDLDKRSAPACFSFVISAVQFINEHDKENRAKVAEPIVKFITQADTKFIFADTKMMFARLLFIKFPDLFVQIKSDAANLKFLEKLWNEFSDMNRN